MAARRWDVRIGSEVNYQGRLCRITHYLDLETVLAQDLETGEKKRLLISQIGAREEAQESAKQTLPDLTLIPEDYWREAQRRFEIIKPLIEHPDSRTAASVEARATEYGIHRATLYRWLERYSAWPNIAVLIPQERSGGRGRSRLNDDAEAILRSVIEDYYLTDQKIDIATAYEELELRCKRAGIPVPHCNTLRNRVASIPARVQMKRREGSKAAQDRFGAVTGSFPGADWPLAVVQIDHTLLDIIVVDEQNREPIGRPWITLAIDVFSRVVVGFYITMEKPSALSVGLCLAHAILPKERWLTERGIQTGWPVWGFMRTIHMDNAKEFRGEMMERACEHYGITLEFRPVGRPYFGGHIERLLGTFARKIHALPGSTFSNVRQKGRYPSSKKAAMTMAELEQWLTIRVVELYHQKVHSELMCPPIKKYEIGLLGDGNTPGSGLPERIVDEARLRIDFMPCIERTVQRYGIQLDEIYYYSDSLRHWIHAEEQGAGHAKRKFIVRRDPRDISVIYFWDPELKTYLEIPYRNVCNPAITLWELNEIRQRLKDQGIREVDEAIIFGAYEKLRQIEESSVKETQRVRRNRQRRLNAQKAVALERSWVPDPDVDQEAEKADSAVTEASSEQDIEPFLDISR